MCGISGIINHCGNKPKEVKSMTDVIRHRGPDGEGYLFMDYNNQLKCFGGEDTSNSIWSSNYPYSPKENINNIAETHFSIAMGHRRLSILDLTPSGHQPMSYRNGRFWITFNGEVYNYKEIKAELIGIGHNFISETDTEVVLAAFAEWGSACLDRLAGMWAFAIYDKFANEIFLARDRYGIKPLYYWFSPEMNFYFASEIKQFTVCKGWSSRINPRRACDFLIYTLTDHTDETMFEGVYQIPSGCCFKSTLNDIKPDVNGRIGFQKWYFLKSDPFKGSFNEAASCFKSLFERSVAEHLNADVKVGTALSGGLDSSAIVCEVDWLQKNGVISGKQQTFSSCSKDERFDEKKWMDIVIDKTDVNAHFVYPDLQESTDYTPDILWYHDEPYQSQSAFLEYSVFRLAKLNGVKVLLNGQGADEYLGGYGQFTSSRYTGMLKKLKISRLLYDIRKSCNANAFSKSALPSAIGFSLLPSSLVKGLRNVKSRSDRIRSLIDIDRLGVKYSHPYNDIPVNYKTVPDISEHFTFYSSLPKYLRDSDRDSMAHSVEARVPFLDHRLVEFTYNLPDDFLEQYGLTKRIMRQALSGLLPLEIKNRIDKIGFIAPEEIWVKKDNPKLYRQKILETIKLTDGFIKPEALSYFDKVVNGQFPFDYSYWRLIIFGEWVRRFSVTI